MQKKKPAAPGTLEFLRENPIFFSLHGEPLWEPTIYRPDGTPCLPCDPDAQWKDHLRYHRDFKKAGVRLFSFQLDNGWAAPDAYDYTYVDLALKHFFDNDPDGYILPRIKVDAPLEWCREHPEDIFLFEWGRDLTVEQVREKIGTPEQSFWFWRAPDFYPNAEVFHKGEYHEKAPLRLQSLSSKAWMADAAEAVRKLIEHLESGPYANRIAGYHLGFGNAAECLHWFTDDLKFGDYGIGHLKRFYDFGIEKYGSREALAAAWRQPDITRDTVYLPPLKERYYGGTMSYDAHFRARPQDVICRDMDIFHSQNVAEGIEAIAAAAKTVSTKPVGFFYGYFLFPKETQYMGHLQFERVLRNPNVDFFCAPNAYYRRGPAEASMDMSAVQSINREKLFIEEMDVRTYLVPTDKDTGITPVDVTTTPAQTRYVLWRHLCKNLYQQSGFWWMDLGKGWYDDPPLMAEIAKLKAAHDLLKDADHESAADVLLLVEDTGMVSMQISSWYSRRCVRDFIVNVRTSGVQFDLYHVCDLPNLDLSRYRMVVFAVDLTLTPEQLAAIPFPKDTTVVFNQAVGILQGGVASLANVERVTGFRVKESFDDTVQMPCMEIVGENDPLIATKVVDGVRFVMIAKQAIPPADFRRVAREAGCHVYTDEDAILFGDESFLGVFAKRETHTVLHLNGKNRCRDVRTGKVYEGDSIPLDLYDNDFLVLQYI